MIIRQQLCGENAGARIPHGFARQGNPCAAQNAQRLGAGQNAGLVFICIVAQCGTIANKNQRLFTLFYKSFQRSDRFGGVRGQPGVGGKVKAGPVHLAAAGGPGAAAGAKIEGFCSQLAARFAAAAPAEIAVPGDPDYRAYNGLPLKPTGGLRCIRCGLCADNCPAGAIPKAAPQKVDKHKCISCLRCIQICPQSARGVPLPLRLAAAATVKKYCTGRKEPKFYL